MILVTGASGFLGGHVLRCLVRRGVAARALVHRGEVAHPEVVRGDLAEPDSLDGAFEGVSAVVHAASFIGEDAERCERVNGAGTEALVRRFSGPVVYASNTAVYGWAVHDGATEAQCAVAPVTVVSRSRQRAEQAVLGAGGAVVRPTFVYGEGDTRFVPALRKALDKLPFLVGGGRARISVIAAADLAEVLCDLATVRFAPGVFHANDQRPIAVRELAELLHAQLGTRVPRRSLPYPVARLLLRVLAPRLIGASTSGSHRLFLVSKHHCYDAGKLWSHLGRPAPAPLAQRGDALRALYA